MPRSTRSHARSASRAASSIACSPPRRSCTCSRSPTTCASSTASSPARSRLGPTSPSNSNAGRAPTPGSASAIRRSWTSALSLMRRPAQELHDMVSESVWFRLGQGIGSCVHHVSQLLADGTTAGVFDVQDPDYTAHVLDADARHDAPRAHRGRRKAGRAGDPGALHDRARARDRLVRRSSTRRRPRAPLRSRHDARAGRGSPRTPGARDAHQGRSSGRFGDPGRGRGVRQDRRARARSRREHRGLGALRRRRRGRRPAARPDPERVAHRAAGIGRRDRRAPR